MKKVKAIFRFKNWRSAETSGELETLYYIIYRVKNDMQM